MRRKKSSRVSVGRLGDGYWCEVELMVIRLAYRRHEIREAWSNIIGIANRGPSKGRIGERRRSWQHLGSENTHERTRGLVFKQGGLANQAAYLWRNSLLFGHLNSLHVYSPAIIKPRRWFQWFPPSAHPRFINTLSYNGWRRCCKFWCSHSLWPSPRPQQEVVQQQAVSIPNNMYLQNSPSHFQPNSLIALNGWIVLLLITSSTNGYDGSMMNGLQSLPYWDEYFGKPRGSKLGLLNAIQVRAINSATLVLLLIFAYF